MEHLLWMKNLVHKKIMQTKDASGDKDGFDPEEAKGVAVDKRKFLIKRLLKDHSFTEKDDDEDE